MDRRETERSSYDQNKGAQGFAICFRSLERRKWRGAPLQAYGSGNLATDGSATALGLGSGVIPSQLWGHFTGWPIRLHTFPRIVPESSG